MAVTGAPDGPPLRAGPPIADLVAGLYGAIGVCAALVKRGRTGAGETVGSSLNSGLISLLGFLAANHFATGHLATGNDPQRTGNDHAIVAPYGMFRDAGRRGRAGAGSREQSYQRLVDAVGAPELRDDPRFRTNGVSVADRAAIDAAIEARRATGTTEYWIEKPQRRRGAVRPGHGPRRNLRTRKSSIGDGADPDASHGAGAVRMLRLPDQVRRAP